MTIGKFFELLIEEVTTFQYEYNVVTFKHNNKVHEINILGDLNKQFQSIFYPQN